MPKGYEYFCNAWEHLKNILPEASWRDEKSNKRGELFKVKEIPVNKSLKCHTLLSKTVISDVDRHKCTL